MDDAHAQRLQTIARRRMIVGFLGEMAVALLSIAVSNALASY